MIFYKFYAAKGGTKPKMVIFPCIFYFIQIIYCRNRN
jgi:hypothetical protein